MRNSDGTFFFCNQLQLYFFIYFNTHTLAIHKISKSNSNSVPQEYMLPEVFNREHLIGVHKKAKKVKFDIDHYNRLKDEEYELQTMLRIIRGPLHIHQSVVEQKRRERLELCRTGTSSSSSSSSSRSPSSSPSPSPTPERTAPTPAATSTVPKK